MTTIFGFASGALGAGPPVERQRHGDRDTKDELWALAIAQLLVEHAPRLRMGGGAAALHGGGSADDSATSGTENPAHEPTSGAAPGPAGSDEAPTRAHTVPDRLTTELLDGRLGRLQLIVERGATGLRIVINVADSHVKALIMADQESLVQSLKDAGLSVASVQIGRTAQPGTALAPDRAGADRTRDTAGLRRANGRFRGYQDTHEEEDGAADAETERVDFTA
jgi:hypothetical protein